MENEKDKVREHYSPEHTPNPPQTVDPSLRKERNEPDKPVESPEGSDRRKPSDEDEKKEKAGEGEKRLGESETEINDETTI